METVELGKNSEDEKKLISSFSSTILADAFVILMFMMTTKLLTWTSTPILHR